MKKTRLLLLVMFSLCFSAQAQLQKIINTAKSDLSGSKKTTPTNSEIADGLKQALQVGAKKATDRVSVTNGFFGNALLKILMPPEAKKVETKLRDLGMGDQVDRAILAMNRGAEDASKKALPIFTNAITSITIQDGITILRGNKDAATQYLRNKTYTALYNAFLPVIRTSLDQTGATRYWAEIFGIYDRLPFVEKVPTDLPAYVTQKALTGIFICIAQEEQKIRDNPVDRITDLLKKVFGSI